MKAVTLHNDLDIEHSRFSWVLYSSTLNDIPCANILKTFRYSHSFSSDTQVHFTYNNFKTIWQKCIKLYQTVLLCSLKQS